MNKISIKRPQDELFILTINGGSSTLSLLLYQTDKSLKKSLNGSVDRIGLPGTNLTFSESDGKNKHSLILESSAMFVWIAEGFGFGAFFTLITSRYVRNYQHSGLRL